MGCFLTTILKQHFATKSFVEGMQLEGVLVGLQHLYFLWQILYVPF